MRPYRTEGGRPKADTTETVVSVPIAIPEQVPVAAARDDVEAPPSGIPVVEQVQPAQLQTQAAPVPVPPTPALSGTRTPMSKSAPATAVASPPSVSPPLVKNDVALPSQVPVTTGSGVLGLTFSDRSWVQVLDANGKVVVDKIFKGGDTEEVTGKAPFTVVIGNSKATRLAYNGKEIDLAPHTRATVARMTVK